MTEREWAVRWEGRERVQEGEWSPVPDAAENLHKMKRLVTEFGKNWAHQRLSQDPFPTV